MKFLLDENFPKACVTLLEERGHETIDVRGTAAEGMPDQDIFSLAQGEGAILLTTDKDFFHTVPFLFAEHHGVVVIALRRPNRKSIMERLAWTLENLPAIDLSRRVLLLTDSQVILSERSARGADP